MTRFVLAVLVVGSLLACSRDPAPITATDAVAAGEVKPATKPCPTAAFSYEPLPAGVGLPFPVHMRDDRITAKPDGSLRRVVVFEYLEGDQRSTMDALAASLVQAGYKAGRERVRSDGRLETRFRNGTHQLVVSVTSAAGAKPSHPSAKGTFGIGMPYTMAVQQPVQ